MLLSSRRRATGRNPWKTFDIWPATVSSHPSSVGSQRKYMYLLFSGLLRHITCSKLMIQQVSSLLWGYVVKTKTCTKGLCSESSSQHTSSVLRVSNTANRASLVSAGRMWVYRILKSRYSMLSIRNIVNTLRITTTFFHGDVNTVALKHADIWNSMYISIVVCNS